MRSTLSTPFCSVIRRVSGPINGFACSAAFSVSQSLTANSTISTGPTSAGSSVDLGVFQMQIAERAFDLQPVLADGIEMRAARDEMHLVSGRGHARAEISADRARRHHCNTHEKSRLLLRGGIFPPDRRKKSSVSRSRPLRDIGALMLADCRTATCRGDAAAAIGQHHHLGADLDAVVKIDHVVIEHADAARRHAAADGRRHVGAVNAISRIAEIERARAERIAFAAGDEARQIGLACDHVGGRIPVRPFGSCARYSARPTR